jgi:hypothetical protein
MVSMTGRIESVRKMRHRRSEKGHHKCRFIVLWKWKQSKRFSAYEIVCLSFSVPASGSLVASMGRKIPGRFLISRVKTRSMNNP